MSANGEEPALKMRDVVKRFGGTRALDGANLSVRRGTIHGLVGQNGAGKSTLIKILAGIHQLDSGSIEVAGQRYRRLTPHKVEKLGIHFIHQERLLAPSFTVGEALFLGSEPCVRPLPLLNRRRMRRQATARVRSYFGVDLPVGALISELTPAQQQICKSHAPCSETHPCWFSTSQQLLWSDRKLTVSSKRSSACAPKG